MEIFMCVGQQWITEKIINVWNCKLICLLPWYFGKKYDFRKMRYNEFDAHITGIYIMYEHV
mgnify:CR=1 FL=1